MFNFWLFFVISSISMLILIVPGIDRNLSPLLRFSRMTVVHRIFTIRNELFPFLNPRPKGMDAESKALIELISLYDPYLQLSDNVTMDEIKRLRYHSKRMSIGLHPARSSSCLVQHQLFRYGSNIIHMYFIQHNQIEEWKTSDKPLVLYFHGGGFVYGGIDSYSGFECHLSKDLNMLILHVNFRLAPEYFLENTIDDVIGVYEVLIQNSVNIHQRLIGMGDSSGGMLWIYLLQWLVANNKPLPRAVVLHSPWPGLDFIHLNTEFCIDHYLPATLVFPLRRLAIGDNIEWFELAAEQQQKLNPKAKSFQGFPPLYITAGTDEIFTEEIRIMTENIRQVGVEVILHEGEGLKHSYALFHLWSVKARCVQKRIREWIYDRLTIKKPSSWAKEMYSDVSC